MLLVCSLLLRHMHLGTQHVATIVSASLQLYTAVATVSQSSGSPSLRFRVEAATRAKGLAPIEGPAWALWSVSYELWRTVCVSRTEDTWG